MENRSERALVPRAAGDRARPMDPIVPLPDWPTAPRDAPETRLHRIGAFVGYHVGMSLFALLTYSGLARHSALVREHVHPAYVVALIGALVLVHLLQHLGRSR